MLERIKHESTVDVYGHVTVLRTQRNYMVQQEVRAHCQQFLRIAVVAVTVFFLCDTVFIRGFPGEPLRLLS